jgi:transcriptional regulator with XRE-family HTH domain
MKHLDIKRALADHNITQVQLGEKLGLSPQSLTSVIKGNPTVKKLEDIATAIGCDITDLFYPDPAEEAAEQEKRDGGMEQDIKEGLAHAEDDNIPLSQKLQDLVKRTYPGIKKEEVNELVEKLIQGRYGDKVFERLLQDANEAAERLYWDIGSHVGNGDNRTDNGIYRTGNDGKRTDNGMMRAETFCPHCGKKVRVGVVLLPDE